MIGPTPDCIVCKNLNPENFESISCAAFPDGIPVQILIDQVKHTTVFESQMGAFVFERIEGDNANNR